MARNFKIPNLQWTKNRNRLKTETACDLAFIATNLMFLNRYDETEKEKRLSRKRKANSASSSSSSTIVPAESALIQEPGSGFDDEGDEAEEYDDGPSIDIEKLDFGLVEEQLDNVLDEFDGESFDVSVEIEVEI